MSNVVFKTKYKKEEEEEKEEGLGEKYTCRQ